MDYESEGEQGSSKSKFRDSSNSSLQGRSSEVAKKIFDRKVVEAGKYVFREGESGTEALSERWL